MVVLLYVSENHCYSALHSHYFQKWQQRNVSPRFVVLSCLSNQCLEAGFDRGTAPIEVDRRVYISYETRLQHSG